MANTPVEYDPDVIQSFADSLYAKARSLIATHAILAGLAGLVVAIVAQAIMSANLHPKNTARGLLPLLYILPVAAALMGYSTGRAKAFWLKIQAQTALCQMRIEKNCRKS